MVRNEPQRSAELDLITPDVRHLPEVLEVRLDIFRAAEKGELMEVVARTLAQYDPENVQWTVDWSYSVRRAESLEEARQILVKAISRNPAPAIFHYNLACYVCQLGDLEVRGYTSRKRSTATSRIAQRRWRIRNLGLFGSR